MLYMSLLCFNLHIQYKYFDIYNLAWPSSEQGTVGMRVCAHMYVRRGGGRSPVLQDVVLICTLFNYNARENVVGATDLFVYLIIRPASPNSLH